MVRDSSTGNPMPDDYVRFRYKIGNNIFRLQPGYEIKSKLTTNNIITHTVTCKIIRSDSGPQYMCISGAHQSEAAKPTTAMKSIYSSLGIPKTSNCSGYEFFGFHIESVINAMKGPVQPVANTPRKCEEMEASSKQLHNKKRRNAWRLQTKERAADWS